MKRKIFLTALSISICISFLIIYFLINKSTGKIDYEKAKKLMVVAHPDDETLWGGAHLLDGDYLVVCVTCGNNYKRSKEFIKVIKYTGNQYIMLSYPDKVGDVRSDWKDEENLLYNDIKKIVNTKEWDLIVTHNPDGEYGHIQHQKISAIVKRAYLESSKKGDLYFFGKYYSKNKIKNYEEKLTPIEKKKAKIKIDKLIKMYGSQKFIRKTFNHMFKYEMWQKYDCLAAGECNEEI